MAEYNIITPEIAEKLKAIVGENRFFMRDIYQRIKETMMLLKDLPYILTRFLEDMLD